MSIRLSKPCHSCMCIVHNILPYINWEIPIIQEFSGGSLNRREWWTYRTTCKLACSTVAHFVYTHTAFPVHRRMHCVIKDHVLQLLYYASNTYVYPLPKRGIQHFMKAYLILWTNDGKATRILWRQEGTNLRVNICIVPDKSFRSPLL